MNWQTASASDLGRAIGAGLVDPLDLTKAYLNAIDNSPYKDRIYSTVTHQRALTEAAAASKRAKDNKRLSLLDGVPISWKDLFDTKGIATEAGSELLKGRVPKKDAIVVQNATNAGLVCLGKTHMSELAFSGLGINPITQTPPNIYDPLSIPGGSSSGAAASVAYGLAVAGIGSDTGGSVRIPAAWNGLVGLKTTHNNLSLKGVVPLCPRFDTVGPLCRSIEDAAYLNDILAGNEISSHPEISLSNLQFMIPDTIVLNDLEGPISEEFNHNLDKLREGGAKIRMRHIENLQAAYDLAGCVFTYEAYQQWGDQIEKNPEKMYPEILGRFRLGKEYSAKQYTDSWAQLETYRNEYKDLTNNFDAVLLPTSPISPPHLADLDKDSKLYIKTNLLALRNTRIGNLMGLCALSLPTNTPTCGLMVLGAANSEDRLLSIGKTIQDVI